MRILADTGIWFRFVRRLPLSRKVEAAFEDSGNQRYLCPISSMEVVRKWRAGKLPCPEPTTWLDLALEGFEILPITEPIARQAALWEWEHRDPADRLIAATAQLHGIELWHTDTILQKLAGFPQRYFKAVTL
ncbi:MAG: type II toxin-antitoxin system VapC family toxin [Verrucomicrobiales bacterium]|nr:type II toxin-antitoxin system VapC family toxin [Verrucomicrobiales bacterium]